MEETVVALLKEIKEENEKQRKYMRRLLHFMQATVLAVVILIVLAAGSIVSVLPRLNEVSRQTEEVIANLEVVTGQLAEANLAGMIENVNTLVISSESGMQEALGKIDAINLEALNQSIEDFSAVVEPLARLFGKK